jgi:hypothetical protein
MLDVIHRSQNLDKNVVVTEAPTATDSVRSVQKLEEITMNLLSSQIARGARVKSITSISIGDEQ